MYRNENIDEGKIKKNCCSLDSSIYLLLFDSSLYFLASISAHSITYCRSTDIFELLCFSFFGEEIKRQIFRDNMHFIIHMLAFINAFALEIRKIDELEDGWGSFGKNEAV